ncbi:MAG TPA: hypothetical protein VN893_12185, partial [Bryobacteraceae bacterium]|nr:hypothetical protein [Bryobacteraceae bacterium]
MKYAAEGFMSIKGSFLILCVLLACSCERRLSLPWGASWDARSGTFSWRDGEVRLPVGFTYGVPGGT